MRIGNPLSLALGRQPDSCVSMSGTSIPSAALAAYAWPGRTLLRSDNKTLIDHRYEGDDRPEQPGRGLTWDGSTEYGDAGDTTETVRSIVAWIQPADITSHTDGLLRLATGKTVTIVNGEVTLTGVSGTIRVNDVSTSTIATISDFSCVYIELSADHDLDLLRVAQDGTTYFGGETGYLAFYDRVLTAAEVTANYTQGTDSGCRTITAGFPFDPVVAYDFEDNSTTLCRDHSGNGHDLTLTNAPTLYEDSSVPFSRQNLYGYSDGASSTYVPIDSSDQTKDVTGSAADYTGYVPRDRSLKNAPCFTADGSDDWVESSSNIGITGSSPFSFGGRFSYSTNNLNENLFSLGTYGVGFEICAVQKGSTNEHLLINIWGANYEVDTGIDLTSGWHHVVATYDGTSIRIYVDGDVKDTRERALTLTDNKLYVAGRTGGHNGQYADVSATDVFVYDDKLTDDEILYRSELGASGTDPTTDNLILNWPCSEKVGPKLYDTSGNGNDGTITNGQADNWTTYQPNYFGGITDGISKYEHASLNPLYVKYGDDGDPLSITPPSGYTKTDDYPAVVGLNTDYCEADFVGEADAPFNENLTLPTDYTKGDGSADDLNVTTTDAKDHKFYITE